MSDTGIVYLIQPPQYIGTNIYKAGCSRSQKLTRCKSYGKDTIMWGLEPCKYPFDVEKKLLERFRRKFKLVRGNEWFKGDIYEMKEEFTYVVNCFNNQFKVNKQPKVLNKQPKVDIKIDPMEIDYDYNVNNIPIKHTINKVIGKDRMELD